MPRGVFHPLTALVHSDHGAMSRKGGAIAIAPAVLAACVAAPAPGREPRIDRTPALISDAYTPLPEAFEATIRSPQAWRARVAGGALVLEGTSARRDLVIMRSDVMFDGRNVVGRDGRGTVEVRATPRLCRDGVDGEWLPYTVRITIEGAAPLLGCGTPIISASSSSLP